MYSYAVIYQTKSDVRKSKTMLGKNWVDVVKQLEEEEGEMLMVHMTAMEETESITPLADLYATMWESKHIESKNMFLDVNKLDDSCIDL